jgi:hypothetical protein
MFHLSSRKKEGEGARRRISIQIYESQKNILSFVLSPGKLLRDDIKINTAVCECLLGARLLMARNSTTSVCIINISLSLFLPLFRFRNVCGFFSGVPRGHQRALISLIPSTENHPKTIFQVEPVTHPQINAYPLQGLLAPLTHKKKRANSTKPSNLDTFISNLSIAYCD